MIRHHDVRAQGVAAPPHYANLCWTQSRCRTSFEHAHLPVILAVDRAPLMHPTCIYRICHMSIMSVLYRFSYSSDGLLKKVSGSNSPNSMCLLSSSISVRSMTNYFCNHLCSGFTAPIVYRDGYLEIVLDLRVFSRPFPPQSQFWTRRDDALGICVCLLVT
jgi:hypothetical protein